MKVSRDALLLIGLIAVAVIFALTSGAGRKTESKISTSYSNDADGTKAVYTLLGDKLGYETERLLAPYTNLPEDAAVLVVVAPLPAFPISGEEREALDKWIRNGGTAVFISDSLDSIPARYGSDRQIGRGFVYAINSRKAITNKGARNYKNVLGLVSTIAEHAKPTDLVLFDEYHHGLGRSDLQSILLHTQRQVKTGAAIVGLALLVLCYSRGRRFGAVRSLPSYENRRPEFEFVESVARLYERAGAADVAAGILLNSLRQGLCLKLGLSSDAPRELIVQRLESEGQKDSAQKAGRLLVPTQAGQKMSKSELLHVAQEIHSIEKELGLVRTNG